MNKEFYTKPLHVILLAIVATFLWGCAPSVIKMGYALLALDSSMTSSILLFAGYRFTLAGILVVIIQSMFQKRLMTPEKGALKYILILAMFQTFGQYFAYYLGLARTTGVNAAIITGLGALFVLLLSVYVFRIEKMKNTKLIGCVIGFIGILVMNITSFSNSNGHMTGDLLIVCSNMCYAIAACFMTLFSKKYQSVMLSGYQFILGGLGLVLVGKMFGGTIAFNSLFSYLDLFYLGMISAVAYTIWGLLLSHNPASQIGIYGCFTPIFGVLVSAIVLDEWQQALSISSILALIMIVLAVYIVNKGEYENN